MALRLIICQVSGRDSEALVFHRQLAQSYAHPGVAAPADNMPHTSRGGRGMQTNCLIHSVSPSVSDGVNFLGMLFNAGLNYRAICVARSALSSYLDCKDAAQFGEHKRVRQFIKGVFEKRPALPKYSSTRDVDTVLQYLELYYPHDKVTLKELSYKLVMLLALLSGQRCQTLHCLSVFNEDE